MSMAKEDFQEQNNAEQSGENRPDSEVLEKTTRRRFTAEYKLKILREVDACSESGEVGALLRREGLYFSNLTTWREARERAERKALEPRKRGPKGKSKAQSEQDKQLANMTREIRNLKRKLNQAERIIEVQKKVSELLGIEMESQPDSESSR